MVDIDDDDEKPNGGYAVLRAPGTVPQGGVALRIRRPKIEPHELGPAGWQADPADLAVDSAKQEGGQVRLSLGPEICEHIAVDDRVEILIPALNVRETVNWPFIQPLPKGTSGGVQKRRGPPPGADVNRTIQPGAEAAQDPEPEPIPPGIDETPTGSQVIDTGLDGSLDTGRDLTSEDEPEGEHTPEDPPKRTNWALIGGLSVLLIAAILAALYILGGEDDQIVGPVTPPTPIQPDDPPTDDMADGPQPPAGDTIDSLLTEARACVQSGCSGAEFYDIVERLEALDDWESALLVADLAAVNGDGRGHLWIAQRFDPITHAGGPGWPPAPDAGRALTRYQQANNAGIGDGRIGRDTLCAALEEAATGGTTLPGLPDEDAGRLFAERCDS